MFSWFSGDFELEGVFLARPLPQLGMVAIYLGVLFLTLYLYRRSWGLAGTTRLSLALVRLAVLSLVVTILFEPTVVVREAVIRNRKLAVLVDVSESMSMKDPRKHPAELAEAAVAMGLMEREADEEGDAVNLTAAQQQRIANASRIELVTSLLSDSAAPILDRLGKDLDVSYHTFGKDVRMLSEHAQVEKETLSNLTATESQTSLANALEAVSSSTESGTAGILLMSDGIDNSSTRRLESVVRDLGTRGIPVFTVPVGLSEPDDVSIRNLVMQEVAYSGDRVPIRIQLRSRGYEKRLARLSVFLNDRRVSQRTVQLDGGLQFEDIDFRVDVYEKGAAQVEVVVEPFDDEVSTENNRIERSIRIVNEKINVLYIEGNARWEYRYLRAILKRDPRINATFIQSNVGPEVARNSDEHIERFPGDREQAFQYDLIILGDVAVSFFDADELRLLEEVIRDRGASLLMLCGPMHSPGTYSGTSIEAMLPVRYDAGADWQETAESVYPVLTSEGSASLVMNLENEPEANDRIWSRMAPLDQLPPLLSAKPGATVLATLSDNASRVQRYPLVAWQRYGTGKCMSIATDRLWRLRFKTGDKYHWRFWSQCIQFMTLSRLMGEHKRIRLETDRVVYPLNAECRLYAQVLDDEFNPVMQAGFDVLVSLLDGTKTSERIRLRPDRGRPGMYEGYFVSSVTGRYRVEASEDDQEISNTTEFQVNEASAELSEPNVRRDHLERIADLTGGASLSLGEFAKLPTLINDEPVITSVRSERSLYDNFWVAFLLVGLVGVEWILRRRNDLP